MTKEIWELITALSCAATMIACGGAGTATGGGSTSTGGTGGTGGMTTSLTLEQACQQLATAECDGRARCSSASLIQNYGGDKAVCTARRAALCVAGFSLPGVTATPADVASCGQAKSTVDCVGLFDLKPLPACDFRGSKENGAGCALGSECKSGVYISTGSGTGCGLCREQPAEGSACDPSKGCGHLACSADGYCHPLALLGESCDDQAFPCNGALRCDETSKKCVAFLDEGAACTGVLDCNYNQELGCSQSTDTCEKDAVVDVGDLCSDGETCNLSICMPASSTFKCQAFLADGEVCDGTQACTPPARCTAQKCRLEPPTCN